MNLYIAKTDKDSGVFSAPNKAQLKGNLQNFGYCPKGYKQIEQLFVDNSGFGSPGESALTPNEFLDEVKKGLGYAIIAVGQFQIYIGVYEKI